MRWGSPGKKYAGHRLQTFQDTWGKHGVSKDWQKDGRGNGAGEAAAKKSLIFNKCIFW